MTMPVLVVNGVKQNVDLDPDTPLLYALRNDLGLVGTRFGCGSGQCGSCFVMIDGTAVASCDTPVWAAEGKAITTVEAFEQSRELSALVDAFVAEQAAQCAYCVSGILISAAALLARDQAADERTIREALDKNLCRCGAQDRMIRAVVRASADLASSVTP
jgi:nicotinate dehydrogenase subunit A